MEKKRNKIKAIPRAWIDIKAIEILFILFQLLRLGKAADNKHIPEFEQAFAEYIGTKHAVSFPSCRAGMYFGLKALNLKEDAEVIIPAFTYWADAAMVSMAGLKPVFVDVDIKTATINPVGIEEKISNKTGAIILTHLNGIAAEMESILDIAHRNNLRIIEDCARSCGVSYKGRKLGSFDTGTFSFGYGKNTYLFGGGMVTSDDDRFISRLREFKTEFKAMSKKQTLVETLKGCLLKMINSPVLFGFSLFPLIFEYKVHANPKLFRLFNEKKPAYDRVPSNFYVNMNNVQAKQGLRFLKRIDQHNVRRGDKARFLKNRLSELPDLNIFQVSRYQDMEMLYFALGSKKSSDLQRRLLGKKIDAEQESAQKITRLERFKHKGSETYPHADELDDTILLLPSHPRLSEKDLDYIAEAVKESLFGNSASDRGTEE